MGEWYGRHKAEHIARVAGNRREIKVMVTSMVITYLQEHPCVDCQEIDPPFSAKGWGVRVYGGPNSRKAR